MVTNLLSKTSHNRLANAFGKSPSSAIDDISLKTTSVAMFCNDRGPLDFSGSLCFSTYSVKASKADNNRGVYTENLKSVLT